MVLRVKLLKDTKYGKAGETIFMDNNEAFGLIDSGQATITKDITAKDTKTKQIKPDERQAGVDNGLTT